MTIISPLVKYKARKWTDLNCKTFQYSRTNLVVWVKYLLGCWSPLPRSDPSKMNHYSCSMFVFEASVWRMIGFMTMLIWMKIKTVIFNMANSVTVLAFHNLLLLLWKRSRSWKWTVIKESSTLKLDGLWVIWNMKGQVLVISSLLWTSSSQGLMTDLGSAD